MYQDSPSQQQIADYFDFGMIASMQMPFEIMDSMQLSPPLDFSLPVENPAIIQYSEHIEVGAPTFADAISGEIIKYFIVGDNESGIPVIPQQIYDASQPNPLPFHHQLEQQYYYQQEQQQLSLTSPPTSPAQLQKTTSEAQSLPNVSSTIVSQFKNGSVKPTSPTPTNTSATVAAVARKQKSMRFKATPAELSYLLSIFEANPFPTAAKRAEICDRLNLSDKQVVVWFQNRRASCKANGILAVKPPKKNGSSKSRLESIAFKAKKNGAVALSQLSEENPYFFELQRIFLTAVVTKKTARIEIAICVVGIYTCFLSWGILQERVTTTEYVNPNTGKPEKFKFFVFLNVVQSVIATLVAFVYLTIKGTQISFPSVPLRNKFIQLSFISVCAAPFGYASLEYIDYPTMILGKTGKLVPVMLMNILLYRKSFPWQKYLVVALITAGMSLFMLQDPKTMKKSSSSASTNLSLVTKLWGITLLSINLILDGVTNSTQDEIFRTFRNISGTSMMLFMNLFSSAIMAVFLGVSNFFPPHELSRAIAFCATHPHVLGDVILFGVCGALGQCFIFHTIERFGSLLLVTITVTRKMGSILMSVFLYNHSLVFGQWCAVALVFAGIFAESFLGGIKHGKGKTSDAKKDDDASKIEEDKLGLDKDDGVVVVDENRDDTNVRLRKAKK